MNHQTKVVFIEMNVLCRWTNNEVQSWRFSHTDGTYEDINTTYNTFINLFTNLYNTHCPTSSHIHEAQKALHSVGWQTIKNHS